ncbi:site-specific DNA-methyltransferase [uncultured Alistipes sp.]|uniref:site-specific DNA-methyltransferase n=1 Tax=uncultured Alistipes sp. TaxID=538949 RepID=UPI00265A632A|nr:site-specific DNA-methyltransferase [uncultured Alistipes sp.]
MATKKEVKGYADGIPVYCAHDAIVPVGQMRPNPKNPNMHPDEQLKRLGAIIRGAGWRNAITVSLRSGLIVRGHGRLAAAQLEGLAEVPVDYQNYASEAEELADLVADNRIAELADPDMQKLAGIFEEINAAEFPIEMTGFTFAEYSEIADALSAAAENLIGADDEVPLPKNPISKRGDLWILGDRHRVYCGDSTKTADVAKVFHGGGYAHLLLTDPPYNVDYEGGTKEKLKIENDNMSDSQFEKFLTAAFKCAKEHMNPGAAFYIFHADSNGLTFRKTCEDVGMHVRQCLIWVKNAFVMGRQDYQWKHEPCLYGWIEGGAHYFTKDRSQATVYEDEAVDYTKLKKQELLDILMKLQSTEEPTTVIHENKPAKNDIHPTMKPVALLLRLIKNSTRRGEIVFDDFCGSGSTLIACEQADRTCYAIEYDPKYVDAIVKRYVLVTGKNDVVCIRNGKQLSQKEMVAIFREE